MRIWNQYAPRLNRLGLLETLDAIGFALLCDGVAGYIRIREELSHEQLVHFIGESGHPTPNPLCALMRSQTKGVRELLSDFGMTPAARTSLTGSTSAEPAGVEDVDPIALLLQQMNGGGPPAANAPATIKARAKKKTTKRAAKKAAKRQPKKSET